MKSYCVLRHQPLFWDAGKRLQVSSWRTQESSEDAQSKGCPQMAQPDCPTDPSVASTNTPPLPSHHSRYGSPWGVAPHILPSPTPICSGPPDLWSPFLHISRQLRGNRDHITKQVIAVPREIRKGVTTVRTTRSGYKNMNVQGMKTLLEIKTMLADMAISTEGLEDIIEKIFWKTQRKGWKMGVKR